MLGLAGLALVIGRLRRTSADLRQRANALEGEIAERQGVEAALRESEERYRHIINAAADAIALGFSEFSDKVFSSLQKVPPEDRWKEVVRWYLSPEHCDRPGTGCPVVTLAPEIARAKLSVRKRIAGLMKELTDRWAGFMPGVTAMAFIAS